MVKKRKCKNCKKYTDTFIVVPAGVFCSIDSALEYTSEKRKKVTEKRIKKQREEANKAKRREYREIKKRLKPRTWHMNKAQKACNEYIRLRDSNLACISCGRYHNGQYHAGHYLTIGAHPELRFNELNIHAQCAPCNNELSGNLINYRINLIKKIGINQVEWLESYHKLQHLTIEQINSIEKFYKKKSSSLKNIIKE